MSVDGNTPERQPVNDLTHPISYQPKNQLLKYHLGYINE